MMALSTTRGVRVVSIRSAQRAAQSVRSLSTRPPDNPPFAQAVVLEYAKLQSGFDYSQEIEKAYGKDGLGLLVVTGIPGYYALRQRLLPMIHKFANLPVEQRAAMEHPQGYVGWAHGKEKLGATGEPDLLKANYKANPQYNIPTMDKNLIKQYPEYCTPNMWPNKTMPDFEDSFMSLGQTVVAVGFLIAKQCDRFIKKRIPDWPVSGKGSLFQTLSDSYTCKARALHYYPPPALDPKMDQLRDWCGWHNDHGSLTGLTSAMYIDKNGNEVQNPDPRAGLVVAPRKGSPYPEHVKVAIPPEALAFQIGECSQLVSGGHLQATPHMVKGPSNPDTIARGISRSTFAVFMQPGLHDKVDLPKGSSSDAIEASPWVPDLRSRYTPGQDFITFTKSTLAKYYEFEQLKAKQIQ